MLATVRFPRLGGVGQPAGQMGHRRRRDHRQARDDQHELNCVVGHQAQSKGHADDYEGNARLADAITTPIQIGENFNGPEDMHIAMQAKAMDYVMIDPQFIRGVTGWMETTALARMGGYEMSSHTFVEASSHLLCATPTADWPEHMDVVGQLLVEPYALVDGTLTPPERPGLGMEWDEDMVNKHQIQDT